MTRGGPILHTGAMGTVPDAVAPMLAVDGKLPDDGRHGYEWKWDGFRGCARVADTGDARITSRSGSDHTHRYPELLDVFAPALGGHAAVLDGEVVAVNAAGRPEFELMQRRAMHEPTAKLRAEVPVVYFAFDLLRIGAESLLDRPYEQRRELLAELVRPADGRLVVPPWYSGADIGPDQLLATAAQHGIEGVVAKRLDAPYLPGTRSPLWTKRALTQTREVVVGGWRTGAGRRAGTLGALLLGGYDDDGTLVYVGDVGTGFTDDALDHLRDVLAPLARPRCPFGTEVPRDRARGAHWVEPDLVGEVVFRRVTPDRRLRHTSWRGLRPDRAPGEVGVPEPTGAA
ncbi:bifunctional non-homologous end joining protein LigD [Amycolatopsis pretoriensis]|uniref:DNA ligase (ATP) n=2 Tax=Amycolatopsis pretoriensis TaxID=218821 RepID=A0A1H5Q3W4_9PSEU|nr:bifunctional non-homologous end joining protein LigD [Amycolatopsis pretoriensis]